MTDGSAAYHHMAADMLSCLATQKAPEPCSFFAPLKAEDAGDAGCPMHPQPGVRILVVEVCTPVFTAEAAEAPETSGIPHAMVYELYALFPGTIGCV